jgi:hypothetical protein
MGRVDTAALLFSVRALEASLGTVKDQGHYGASHTADGLYYHARSAGGTDERFRRYIAWRQGESRGCAVAGTPAASGEGDEGQEVSRRSTLDLEGLRHVIRLARQRGVELRLVFYPRHAYVLEMDELCGAIEKHWQVMEQVAELVEKDAPGDRIQVWEFFGYNRITAEPVGPRMNDWQDPEHFNFEFGEKMMETMFGANPDTGLGRRVRRGTAELAFKRFQAERRAFLARNPQFHSELQRLLPPR